MVMDDDVFFLELRVVILDKLLPCSLRLSIGERSQTPYTPHRICDVPLPLG